MQQGELSAIFVLQKLCHILEKACLHGHDVPEILNIAHLEIQPGIFIQVALRVMLLRPEHRSNLHHTVKHADHHLLVKLRALSQHGGPGEVFQFKDIRASLRPSGPDLRRVDLRETLTIQEVPECTRQSFLNPELRPFPYIPQGDRSIVKLSLQRGF